MSPAALYSFRRCPYAMRARMALLQSGVAFELREIALRHKPPQLLAASPKGTVPVLVLPSGAVLEQSLDIMLWALRQHDPDDWLLDAAGLDATLALIAQCDGPFKQQLDRYKYPNRYLGEEPVPKPLEQRAAGAQFLQSLEARLQASAWLHGSHMALADIAIMPFVRQFAATDAAWFTAQDWPALKCWLQVIERSTLFERCMDKQALWVF
jgi:glutathione S-transferase